MSGRGRALGAVLALLCLPPLVALAEAVAFHVRNRSNRKIRSSGVWREYQLYVPPSYDPARPTPLVLSLHGAGGWPVLQQEVSGWNAVAEEHGFVVAYPSALGGRGTRSWHLRPGPGLDRDVRFVSDLIDQVESAYDIDPRRIYVNGLSAGGGMSFALACALPKRIAAIGTVAAARLRPWSGCTDRPPVPVIAFHGTADPVVPYHGGASWIGSTLVFPDVEDWMATWARRNRCRPDPFDSSVARDATRREYRDCADDADVVLFTLRGGGHTWPGGEPLPEWFLGPTNRSVDATREMWTFFEEHPLGGR